MSKVFLLKGPSMNLLADRLTHSQLQCWGSSSKGAKDTQGGTVLSGFKATTDLADKIRFTRENVQARKCKIFPHGTPKSGTMYPKPFEVLRKSSYALLYSKIGWRRSNFPKLNREWFEMKMLEDCVVAVTGDSPWTSQRRWQLWEWKKMIITILTDMQWWNPGSRVAGGAQLWAEARRVLGTETRVSSMPWT